MADATYHFLSFVRSGFVASITQPDTFGTGQPALASASVGVSVSGIATPVIHQAVIRGPGDVIGLAASQVVRTDPIDGAVGVEPNYFAQIEFDRPDLPWLFTPAAAAGERLRPWLVLLVVDLDGPHPCTLSYASPLPRLHVPADAASQLPDLAASYLWAHAQVVTPDGQTVSAALDGDPRLSSSRLMCPRHLEPFRWYLAAVVPAFEVGRLAGVGQAVTPEDEARLDAAWRPGGEVVLPVYYSFRFRTGEEADFESLVRKLKGRPLPSGVGTRPLDVSRPGAGLPSFPVPASVQDRAAIVWLDGALRPLDSDSLPQRDPAASQAFRASLTILLDRPATLRRGGDVDPVVAPPSYGDKHALVVELGAGSPPPWVTELNLDPRTRVAAGLATQVVQAHQEDLVARAWHQLGDVLAANRLLRAAQLARSGSLRVHSRLATLDAPTLLAVSSPAHARVAGVMGTSVTLANSVRASRLPAVAVEPAFRRLARPSAVAARAAGTRGLSAAVIARFAGEVFSAPVAGPDGVTSMRPATDVIGTARASAALAAIGDEQPYDASRLDGVLSTLNSNAKPLPTGDAIRAGTARSDVGAVSFVNSLGAVPAEAVSALLGAAAQVAPPALPPPVRRPVPPVRVPGPLGPRPFAPGAAGVSPAAVPHLPQGLASDIGLAARDRSPAIIFQPAGPQRVLGGDVMLRAGRVVIDTETLRSIVAGTLTVRRVDDTQWAGLVQASTVPAVLAGADPLTDPGSRLDVFRRDSGALSALAQLAGGHPDAALALDVTAGQLVTAGAGAASLKSLAAGTFEIALPQVVAKVTGADDLAASREIIAAAATAFDRFATVTDAPPPPAAPALDLDGARSGLLGKIDPETTVAARVRVRLDVRAIIGVPPRDELDPVMACPKFLDPMWEAMRDLGHGWLLPGLELVPPDTATLLRTNPSFVVTLMVGLNHEFMRELLWREYPTDQRGTAFARFWGRSGNQPDDIGPVHLFTGGLVDNLLTGKDGEAVLLLRSELLRRYPGSIIYLCRATQQGDTLALDDGTIVLPTFRGDLPPDVTFVGFPIPPDTLRAGGDPWWFVIAQPPSEPRFGLDEWSSETPAVPTTANDLAWSHLSADGRPETPVHFAEADPPMLRGDLMDGLTWGASAAVQAHLTYQHPVRVAIRAADLLPPQQPTAGSPNTPGGPS